MTDLREVIAAAITSYIDQGGSTPLCIMQDRGGLTALSVAHATRATFLEGFEAFRTEAMAANPAFADMLASIVPRCQPLDEDINKASEPWLPLTIEAGLDSIPDPLQRIFLRTWVLKVMMLDDHAYNLCSLALRDIRKFAMDCPLGPRNDIMKRVATIEQSITGPEEVCLNYDARTGDRR